jgi:hypothetical protein
MGCNFILLCGIEGHGAIPFGFEIHQPTDLIKKPRVLNSYGKFRLKISVQNTDIMPKVNRRLSATLVFHST